MKTIRNAETNNSINNYALQKGKIFRKKCRVIYRKVLSLTDDCRGVNFANFFLLLNTSLRQQCARNTSNTGFLLVGDCGLDRGQSTRHNTAGDITPCERLSTLFNISSADLCQIQN